MIILAAVGTARARSTACGALIPFIRTTTTSHRCTNDCFLKRVEDIREMEMRGY